MSVLTDLKIKGVLDILIADTERIWHIYLIFIERFCI